MVKIPTTDKRPQAHAGVSRSPSFLRFPSYVPPIVLPRALQLLCVLDTSWHVTNGPGHLFAPLSWLLSATALTTLLCRGALCCEPVTSAGALQRKVGASQPNSQPANQLAASLARHTLWCAHFIRCRRPPRRMLIITWKTKTFHSSL